VKTGFALLFVVLGVLVLGACSGPDVDDSSIPPIAPSLLAAMPEVQAGILADESVSRSEFERAVLGLVSCLESSGLEVMNVDVDETGWLLGYKSGFDDPARDDADWGEIQAATPQDFHAWARCFEVATARTPG